VNPFDGAQRYDLADIASASPSTRPC